jgi:hypothetical protein
MMMITMTMTTMTTTMITGAMIIIQDDDVYFLFLLSV